MTASIVIVTGDDVEHRYVANRIAQRFPVAALLVTEQPRRQSLRKALRSGWLKLADRVLLKFYRKLIQDDRTRAADLLHVLGPEDCAEFLHVDKVLHVGRPKEGKLLEVLQDLAPDYLIIYGTGIVPSPVLAQAKKLALNMHTGISPQYRGAHCAFWPIHNGEPEWVGATVHECTAEVDGGRIFATVRATLKRQDSLHRIFARAVLAGAQAYAEVLDRALNNRLEGQIQQSGVGREYSGRMRGLAAELKARQRLGKMQSTWPTD
jgi:methionyl-tRNA formyltransferase